MSYNNYALFFKCILQHLLLSFPIHMSGLDVLKLWSFEHNKSGLPPVFLGTHTILGDGMWVVWNLWCDMGYEAAGVKHPPWNSLSTLPSSPSLTSAPRRRSEEEVRIWSCSVRLGSRGMCGAEGIVDWVVFSVDLLPLDRRVCNLVKSLFRWCVIESGKGSNKGQCEKNVKGLNNEYPHWPLTETVSPIHQVWCGLVDRQFTFFHISELSFWWQRYCLRGFYSSPGPQPLCNRKIAVDLEHPFLLIQFLCYSRYLSLGRKWQG